MGQRKHLPEIEIQRLERLSEEELGAELGKMTEKARLEIFRELLASYRLAAHVANRAFGFVTHFTLSNRTRLEEALHGYSPANFPEPAALEEQIALLVELYDFGCSVEKDALLEAIYQRTQILEKRLEEPAPPPAS